MERLSMRKIREYLRLRFAGGLSHRQIAASLQVSRSSVGELRTALCRLGAALALARGLERSGSGAAAVSAVTGGAGRQPRGAGTGRRCIWKSWRRPGVTLMLLWQEYRERHPEGFGYSRFCARYEDWSGSLDVVMRQSHRAGEKLFVDYAGHTAEVVDRRRGEIRTAQIVVAVLGASNYTYAEATWSQGLADWIGSHVRAFAYFDGVPAILVPDNLRSGVSKAHRYEPDVNPTYLELANHDGVAVVPARVRKPRDKAKAETGVQIVERWIPGALRHRSFFSPSALNTAIAALLERLNQRPFKTLPGSRRTAFETIDRPALRALPLTPYVYATWKRVRVNIDDHVEVDGHDYSVPYTLVKQALDVRLTEHTVECFHQRQRVASHVRPGKYSAAARRPAQALARAAGGTANAPRRRWRLGAARRTGARGALAGVLMSCRR